MARPFVYDPSPRLHGSIARIVRSRALAGDGVRKVFGDDTTVTRTLTAVVDDLSAAPSYAAPERAARVLAVATPIAALCDALEMECGHAADVNAALAVIIRECELIRAMESTA